MKKTSFHYSVYYTIEEDGSAAWYIDRGAHGVDGNAFLYDESRYEYPENLDAQTQDAEHAALDALQESLRAFIS